MLSLSPRKKKNAKDQEKTLKTKQKTAQAQPRSKALAAQAQLNISPATNQTKNCESPTGKFRQCKQLQQKTV
jgi:hypothetical protein